eukprot:TRINITY_DN14102_c0_g2_i4.p5 TRINITY_DN14102_c0_g2~~TRINITY_DN14102_c0_g2_i4.p5  ORF type:complete len:107 (-),score=36.15 TRINITY_DN14102_c0_g2_i4:408-728(-)
MNAINSIPAGELDGGRTSLALFDRGTYGAINIASLVFLGVGALGDSLAQYWLLLVLILQRGPIPPVKDEVSPVGQGTVGLGVAVLLLPLLVLLPFPVVQDSVNAGF